jgi:Resolvase, N terminal domain
VSGSLPIRSGTKAERKGLEEALSHLREGDTLVVWRLDRLGRSLRHLIDTITTLGPLWGLLRPSQTNVCFGARYTWSLMCPRVTAAGSGWCSWR